MRNNESKIESFLYDNVIVKKFMLATVIWGIVGMLVGVLIAIQLYWPTFYQSMGINLEYLTFGRLRPLHTNAVIFAFVGNAIFMGVYYSLPRLCKASMWNSMLSNFHFWGWQLIILSAAITLPLGITTGKEYAELEWPIDIMIALAASLGIADYAASMSFMAGFGIGTAPAMFAVSYLGIFASAGVRQKFNKLIPYGIAVIAILMIMRGMALGIPYISPELPDTVKQPVENCCH